MVADHAIVHIVEFGCGVSKIVGNLSGEIRLSVVIDPLVVPCWEITAPHQQPVMTRSMSTEGKI